MASLKAMLLAGATLCAAKFSLHQFQPSWTRTQVVGQGSTSARRDTPKRAGPSRFLNEKTQAFSVNGNSIPDIDFDVGESYAGLLPIGNANGTDQQSSNQQLYYWFFPSTDPAAEKEILIWLTGGENGPFLWQPGTFSPVQNPWSWHRLTNVVWVDQPVGAGFSVGDVTARDESDVANQFMGFWKNFVDTFSLQGYKVYVTGSSYSGMYCPYIASAMLDANDKSYFDVAGMMVFDGLFSNEPLGQDIPVSSFVDSWDRVLPLNETFKDSLRQSAQTCGYTDYLKKYLVFPPAGTQPSELPGVEADGAPTPGCDLANAAFAAATEANPCFSVYDVFTGCPRAYDPLGFSDGSMFIPASSGSAYLNRPDVKKAINAPDKEWVFCNTEPVFVNGTDNSVIAGPGSQPVLPNVIDKTQNVIIGHGARDFVLIADGTLLTIQNLTWGGMNGFQEKPSTQLTLPPLTDAQLQSSGIGLTAGGGSGVVGTVHTERGLTYLGVETTGHFLAMDAPQVAFRGIEVLLKRVDGFDAVQPFTVSVGGGGAASNGSIAAVNSAQAGGSEGGVPASGGVGAAEPHRGVIYAGALLWITVSSL